MAETTTDDGRLASRLIELVDRHYALVYRYAYRLAGSHCDAEDLTQQVFLTAQTRLNQLRDATRAKAWLCAIVRNTYLKSRRARNNILCISLDGVPEANPSSHRERNVDCDAIQMALNELPEHFRSPLILFYFEEFTYQEIAAQLKVPIGTVMSRLARGRKFLRRRLYKLAPEDQYTCTTARREAKPD